MNLPGSYFETMFDMKKRYLNCMNIAWVPMVAQIGGTLLHIFWCYLLVIKFNLDITGLGLATFITNLSLVIMIEVYSLLI